MLYCPRCGVILADGAARCDLCGSLPVEEKPESAEAGGTQYPATRAAIVAKQKDAEADGRKSPYSGEDLSLKDRRLIAFELVSVAFGFALVISVLADLFVEHSFGWSRYSSVGILMAWCASALPLLFWKHPWIMFAALAPSIAALVLLLDVFDGHITWYLTFGLPLVALLAGCSAGAGAILAALKRWGLNVVAVILATIAIFCLGTETIVDLNLDGRFNLQWSPVVGLALVPTAGFLFYLHYRIVKEASLKKLFRL